MNMNIVLQCEKQVYDYIVLYDRSEERRVAFTYDIHTIVLSNYVEYMVDIMSSVSWYFQIISAELLSGNKVFYIISIETYSARRRLCVIKICVFRIR